MTFVIPLIGVGSPAFLIYVFRVPMRGGNR